MPSKWNWHSSGSSCTAVMGQITAQLLPCLKISFPVSCSPLTFDHSCRQTKQNMWKQLSVKDLFSSCPKQMAQFGSGEPGGLGDSLLPASWSMTPLLSPCDWPALSVDTAVSDVKSPAVLVMEWREPSCRTWEGGPSLSAAPDILYVFSPHCRLRVKNTLSGSLFLYHVTWAKTHKEIKSQNPWSYFMIKANNWKKRWLKTHLFFWSYFIYR